MTTKLLTTLIALALLGALVAPAAAAPGATDSCSNADGESDAGPPGFVADVTPDFLSDLIGGLPVPDFVKGAFGAESC